MNYSRLKKKSFLVAFVMPFLLIPLGERNVVLQPVITRFLQLFFVLTLGGEILYSAATSLRRREGKPIP